MEKFKMPHHKWDVFVSHASEDKAEVADPLVKELRNIGLKVWYDKTELFIGDSLRKKIDDGLSKSKYGVVILSESFFEKEWPNKELNALFSRETEGSKVILPIWHNVTQKDVMTFSPMLSDKLAINTSKGISSAANAIAKTLGAPATEPKLNQPEKPSEIDLITKELDLLSAEIQKQEKKEPVKPPHEIWLTKIKPYVETVFERILSSYVEKKLLITFQKCNFYDFVQYYIDQYYILGDSSKTGGTWGVRLSFEDEKFTLTSWTFSVGDGDSVSEKSLVYINPEDIHSNLLDKEILLIIKRILGLI